MVAPLEPLLSGWRSAPLPDLHGTWSVAPGGRAFAIAGLADQVETSLLVVVPGERDAEELVDDISLFLDNVLLAPAWETLPFEHVSPNIGTMAHRSEARHALEQGDPAIVVSSVRGAIQRLSPSAHTPLTLTPGDEVSMEHPFPFAGRPRILPYRSGRGTWRVRSERRDRRRVPGTSGQPGAARLLG